MATQITELLAGGVDIIRTVPPQQIPVIEASGTAYVSMAPILRVVYLGLDCLRRDPTSQAALQDIRVRQAIAHAIDADGIIYHVLGGIGARTATGVTSMHFGYDGDAPRYAYNPEKAKHLLAEAGYDHGLRLNLHTYGGSIMCQRPVKEQKRGFIGKVGLGEVRG